MGAAEARGVLESAEHSAPRRARLMGSGRHHAAALDTRSRPGQRSTTTTRTRTWPRTRAPPVQRLIASFASTGRARVTEFVMQSTQATNQLNPTGVGTRRCARVRLVRGTDTDGPQAPCCCRLQVIGFEISFRARNLSESNIGGRLDPEVADSDVYSLIVPSASTRLSR